VLYTARPLDRPIKLTPPCLATRRIVAGQSWFGGVGIMKGTPHGKGRRKSGHWGLGLSEEAVQVRNFE
jgi:hypothetical protein